MAIDEPYLYATVDGGEPEPTEADPDLGSWTVPEGELFLMGDHRANSADSRTFGTVPVDNVVGRAWLRYWPIETFGILATPTYPELAPSAP
jgi:signal peptidase I